MFAREPLPRLWLANCSASFISTFHPWPPALNRSLGVLLLHGCAGPRVARLRAPAVRGAQQALPAAPTLETEAQNGRLAVCLVTFSHPSSGQRETGIVLTPPDRFTNYVRGGSRNKSVVSTSPENRFYCQISCTSDTSQKDTHIFVGSKKQYVSHTKNQDKSFGATLLKLEACCCISS